MTSDGRALLRFVPAGERKSLENVIEETRLSPRWLAYFRDFRDPYLHLTPEQYQAVAQWNGLRVLHLHTEAKAWDFQSRAAFLLSARWALSNGHGYCPRPSGRRS
jgi:trans-aconitate 2-methyltransferase